jgi:Gnt-I system high-affinity gluconate transporter
MEMAIGIALLVVFLAVVALIIRGQSPVAMLLILAVAWAATAGIRIDGVQAKVLQATWRLHPRLSSLFLAPGLRKS